MVRLEDYVSDDNPIRTYEDWNAAINRRGELEAAGDFGDEWTDLTTHIKEFNEYIDAYQEARREEDISEVSTHRGRILIMESRMRFKPGDVVNIPSVLTGEPHGMRGTILKIVPENDPMGVLDDEAIVQMDDGTIKRWRLWRLKSLD